MTAQLGRNILLKLHGQNGYETVAGLRTRTLDFNLTPINITDSASVGHWQELLSGGGVRTLHVAGEGVFKNIQADETVRSNFFAATVASWQVILPDFGTLQGGFLLTELTYAGDYQGEVTWRIALNSASQISFVSS